MFVLFSEECINYSFESSSFFYLMRNQLINSLMLAFIFFISLLRKHYLAGL